MVPLPRRQFIPDYPNLDILAVNGYKISRDKLDIKISATIIVLDGGCFISRSFLPDWPHFLKIAVWIWLNVGASRCLEKRSTYHPRRVIHESIS
jgi:hypothetical protein